VGARGRIQDFLNSFEPIRFESNDSTTFVIMYKDCVILLSFVLMLRTVSAGFSQLLFVWIIRIDRDWVMIKVVSAVVVAANESCTHAGGSQQGRHWNKSTCSPLPS